MTKPTLGYWDYRGIAGPIRYLLRYKNVDFEDKRYPISDPDSWYGVKFTLGFDFPNVPYYVDGPIKLTQSVTILRYLAEKYDMDGKTEQERLRVSLSEQQIVDLQARIIDLAHSEDFEKRKPEFVDNVPAQLKLFETFLGDRPFLAGDNLTYVDFMAFENIDLCRILVPNVLDQFPNLKTYQERIRNLPRLKNYLQSSEHVKWPIFSFRAYYGCRGPKPEHA